MSVLLQWLPSLIMLGIFVLSIIKSPNERQNLNGGTVKAYAEAARLAGEDARMARAEKLKSDEEVIELKIQLDGLKKEMAYRVTVNFTTGLNVDPKVDGVKVDSISASASTIAPVGKKDKHVR
jgi:hypothetical protein